MKLKGISIFEQHAEKAVLALFVIVAAVLFSMQFLNPLEVEVGNEAYPPERLSDVIRQRADQVRGRLEGDFAPADEPPQVVEASEGLGNDFVERFAALAGRTSIYGETSTPTDIGPSDPIDAPEGVRYAEVEAPAPERAVAIAEAATIDPFVPVRFPGARALLPDEQPLDTRYVSMQTTWDWPEFRERLSFIPEDESINPINPTWWQRGLEIFDVIWECDRLLDDGTWGERRVLNPLPGRETLRAELEAGDILPARKPELLEMEAQRRANIRQPAMYPIIMGPQWLTPVAYRNIHGLVEPEVVGEEDEDITEECARLRQRILSRQREIERNLQLIQRLEEELGRGGGGRGPSRGPAPVRSGMLPDLHDDLLGPRWPSIPENWFAQARSTGPGDDEDDRDAEQRRRDRLEDRIERLQEQNVRYQEEIEQLCERLDAECGIDCMELLAPEGEGQEDQEPLFIDPATQETLAPLSQTDQAVSLWAHDLTVQPGETYRYRARIVVVNPFFGQAGALGEDQAHLAESPTIESEPGAWSEPIATMPETYIRVVSASGANRPLPGVPGRRRPAAATVDYYRFYYGYWRSVEVALEAGDRVIAEFAIPELPVFTIEAADSAQGAQGVEGAGPRVTGEAMLARRFEIVSDLVMSGVFEAVNRRATSDVLFSSISGRTRLASQTADRLWDMIQRSETDAADAEVRTPGTGETSRPGSRPDQRPDRPERQPDRRPGSPSRGPVPSGPVPIEG